MLAEGEHYHVFNRGAHKQAIFTCPEDYDRFQVLMYLFNTRQPIVTRDILANYKGRSLADIFLEEPSDCSLVDVLGYALMPNHFHLILRQKVDAGISRFIRKLCTAYSMYFNTKYEHSGVLFQGRFKASHLDNEAYFRYIFSYVHLNPFELMQSDWKDVGVKNPALARSFLSNYRHSSFRDYVGGLRPERAILAREDIPDFLKDQNDITELLKWKSVDAEPVGLFANDKRDKKATKAKKITKDRPL
jgi:putative transposase